METRHFRDLQVWQRSMELARQIYAVTDAFPRAEVFGLTSQIRRAAVSVPSNIAEGRGRMTDRSFALFLSQARGSLYELQTPVELACDLGFIESHNVRAILAEAAEIASMLHGLLASISSKRS
jgi:four helix bundle protein